MQIKLTNQTALSTDPIITLGIADDHRIYRYGLQLELSKQADIRVLWLASDGKEMLEKIAAEPPEIVLMDYYMPATNTLDNLRMLKKKYPFVKVIILSMSDNERLVDTMLEAGVCAWLTKSMPVEEIYECIRKFRGD